MKNENNYLLRENWSVFKQQTKEKNTVSKFVCERRRKNAEVLKMCMGGGGWKVCFLGEGGRDRVEGW